MRLVDEVQRLARRAEAAAGLVAIEDQANASKEVGVVIDEHDLGGKGKGVTDIEVRHELIFAASAACRQPACPCFRLPSKCSVWRFSNSAWTPSSAVSVQAGSAGMSPCAGSS